MRSLALVALFPLLLAGGRVSGRDAPDPPRPRLVDGAYQVYPGEEIQEVLEMAARDAAHKRVEVHAGTYRPRRPGQALIWFNDRHDGLIVEARGRVVLTAANPEIAELGARSFPAVINHVVYFGDGVTNRTVLRGFEITGSNAFVTRSDGPEPIERALDLPELQKGNFFYSDGGGIKIFGRSYPTLENLLVYENYTEPCGGGISVEHRGFLQGSVVIRNSVFRDNRTQITGSAVDLLPGSSAIIENCLFVGNISNTGPDDLSPPGLEYQRESGSGALTVFAGSRVWVRNSTFTANWNGVDDKGSGNVYSDSIFWRNVARGGVSPGPRYELDLLDGSGVTGCRIHGEVDDATGEVSGERNVLGAPDPDFDEHFVPRAPLYEGVGYRPVSTSGETGRPGP